MRTKLRTTAIVAIGLVFAATPAGAQSMGTAFTYQGQLKQGGIPVNDTCEFDVGLWTAETGGDELGSQVVETGVTNGLFTIRLNETGLFGADAFNGDRRWLDIGVSCPPGGTFVPLGRQELTPAPYAMRAAAGGGGGTGDGHSLDAADGAPVDAVYVANDGKVGIGTTAPVLELDVVGDVIIGGGAEGYDGPREAFVIRGQSESWTLAVQNEATSDETGFFIGPSASDEDVFHIQRNGNVGIGTNNPTHPLHVKRDWAVIALDTNGVDQDAGIRLLENGVIKWHLYNDADSEDTFRIGSAEEPAFNIKQNGNVGIGTTEPNTKLTIDAGGNLVRMFNLGSSTGEVHITSPGGAPGIVGVANNGNRRDIRFDDGGIRLLTSNTPDQPSLGNGINIDNTGNVGIGTTDPDVELHVKGNAGVLALEGSNHAYLEWYPDGFDPNEDEDNRKGWMGWSNADTINMTIRNEIPEATLDLRSDQIRFSRDDDGAQTWFPWTNGEVYITGDLDGSGNGDIYFRNYSRAGPDGIVGTPDDVNEYSYNVVIEGDTGKVGIGTTDPQAALHVDGTEMRITAAAPQIKFDDNTANAWKYWIHNNNDHLYFLNDGGLGEGWTASRPLTINQDKVGIGTANPTATLTIDEGTAGLWTDGIRLVSGANYWDIRSTSSGYLYFGLNESSKVVFKNNGHVGIGTSSPDEKLDVNGNVRVNGRTIYTSGTGPLITAGHTNTPGREKRMWIGHSQAYPTWGIQYRDLASDDLPADSIEFVRGDTTKPRFSFHVTTGVMRLFDPTGQATVWINPNAGEGGAGVLLSNSAGQNTIELDADEGDDGVMRLFDAAGNMSIRLHSDRAFSAGEISLYALNSSGALKETVEIIASEASSGGLSSNGGQIKLRNSNGITTITLDAEQGDGGPSRIITDVLQITGADLAEKFPVSEEAKPGMVVAIDPDHPGQLRVARGAYNRRVAGVVSGANGLSVGVILGNLPGNEDAPPIAMSGRVYVWADASNGPIETGDLLTTSATPGHAMKVNDYDMAQGSIIGKAMTSLAEGKGLVLVLVSLQ